MNIAMDILLIRISIHFRKMILANNLHIIKYRNISKEEKLNFYARHTMYLYSRINANSPEKLWLKIIALQVPALKQCTRLSPSKLVLIREVITPRRDSPNHIMMYSTRFSIKRATESPCLKPAS